MITRIEATNVKGRDFSHGLSAITAIVGPNRTGKTAVIDAVLLSLLGYHPTLGKRGTGKLMGNSAVMSVFADTSAGTFRQSWKKTPAGGLSRDKSDMPVEWPVPALQTSAFLGLGPKDRLRMLAGLIPDDGNANLASADIALTVAANPAALWHPPVKKSDETELEWIERIAVEVESGRKTWKQDLTTFTQTLRGLDQVEEMPDVSPEQVSTAREAHRAATTAHAQAEARYNQYRNARASMADQTDEVIDLVAAGRVLDEARQARDNGRRRQQWEQTEQILLDRAAAIRGEIDELLAKDQPDMMIPDDFTKFADTARIELQTAAAEVSRCEAEVRRTATALETITRQIANLSGLECCPTCKLSGPGFKDQIAEVFETQRSEASTAALLASANAGNARVAQKDAAEAVDRVIAMERVAVIRLTLGVRQSDVSKVQRELMDHRATWYGPVPDPVATSELIGAVAAAEIELARQQGVEKKRRDAGMVATMSQEDEDALFRIAEQAETDLITAEEKLEALQSKLAQADLIRNRTLERARIEKRITDAEAAIKALDAIEAQIRTSQVGLLERLCRPVLAVADHLCRGIFDGGFSLNSTSFDLEIHDEASESTVSFETFSGAEKLIATAALQIALATSAPFRLAILDEFTSITGPAKEQFVANLLGAIRDGTIRQVLLTDHDSGFWSGRAVAELTVITA